MNAIAKFSSLATACCLLVGLSLLAGCSPSPGSGVVVNSTPQLAHALSASEAAQLAARLANEECERRFHRHPFQADQQSAILQDGEYPMGWAGCRGAKRVFCPGKIQGRREQAIG